MSPIPTYSDLRDQTVLVTGGGNGIGASIVRAFHAHGARVFLCDTDVGAGRSLGKVLGSNASFTRVDLAKEAQIVRWATQITRDGKPLRVLVNNAARDPRMMLENMSAKDWDDLFATNLRAFFLMARETAPDMPVGAGTIINLASITFHIAPAAMSAYVATKGVVLGFTRSLARELGPRGLRVNTVSPGWIMTERQLNELVTPAAWLPRATDGLLNMTLTFTFIIQLIAPEKTFHASRFRFRPGKATIKLSFHIAYETCTQNLPSSIPRHDHRRARRAARAHGAEVRTTTGHWRGRASLRGAPQLGAVA